MVTDDGAGFGLGGGEATCAGTDIAVVEAQEVAIGLSEVFGIDKVRVAVGGGGY